MHKHFHICIHISHVYIWTYVYVYIPYIYIRRIIHQTSRQHAKKRWEINASVCTADFWVRIRRAKIIQRLTTANRWLDSLEMDFVNQWVGNFELQVQKLHGIIPGFSARSSLLSASVAYAMDPAVTQHTLRR